MIDELNKVSNGESQYSTESATDEWRSMITEFGSSRRLAALCIPIPCSPTGNNIYHTAVLVS